MKNFRERLFDYYKLTDESFKELSKEYSFNDLPDPFKYEKMDLVVNKIKELIFQNKKIIIYGDYDCDGIMSTSILYLTLKKVNYIPGFCIPIRKVDGYGLTKEKIDAFKAKKYDAIILIDNGITLVDEVEYAKKMGMDVIIMDHHTPGDKLPDTEYILHPVLSNFSKRNMSAGTVAFFFSYAYLGYVDEYLLTLAMISTISDLMEVLDYNRIIIKLGLKCFNKNVYTNISKLLVKENFSPINENDVGLNIAPKVNAIGRIIEDTKVYDIVRYFINFDDIDYINKKIDWILEVNNTRKQIVKDFFDYNDEIDEFDDFIFIVDPNLNEGILGLVAAKYIDSFNKPSIVCGGRNESNVYKGSIRSRTGFDVNEFFNANSDLLEAFGGHQAAGGFSIKEENISEFKNRFKEASLKHKIVETIDYIDINTNEINYENYELIDKLSPFGEGLKKPNFRIADFNCELFRNSISSSHLIHKLNFSSSIIYFNFDKDILGCKSADLFGHLVKNIFKNYINIEFIISNYKKIK